MTARRTSALERVRAVAAVVLALALCAAAVRAADDAGFELEIDLELHELRARDLRTGESFGRIPVAIGSPAHPTPRGRFRIARVLLNPAWTPGAAAAAAGAEPEPPSLDSPMGVAKLPFAEGGAIALHGGGNPHVLGIPVSSGCVRAADADLLRLIAWIHLRDGLAPARRTDAGELHRDFRRPARVNVR